jgi:hypothetical protein
VTRKRKSVIGRPKITAEKKRGKFISTRLSAKEATEIRDAIKGSGKTKSNWVRDALLNAARIG